MNEDQQKFQPVIQGAFPRSSVYVCGGMGGSALPVLVARFLGVQPYVIMHRDYGMPEPLPQGAAAIAISYSGNTEEILSFAKEVLERSMPLAIITSGGALLAFAQEHDVPFVQIPGGQQPRNALTILIKALLALIGEDTLLAELSEVHIDEESVSREAQSLVEQLADTAPIFYSSTCNEALSYIAKIECNETGKVPAFSNVFPELNHNEMQGLGSAGPQDLRTSLTAVFMKDATDSERIRRRMELTQQLLQKNGMRTAEVVLPSDSRAQTFVYGLALTGALARSIAERRGADPEAVPLIEEFKKKL